MATITTTKSSSTRPSNSDEKECPPRPTSAAIFCRIILISVLAVYVFIVEVQNQSIYSMVSSGPGSGTVSSTLESWSTTKIKTTKKEDDDEWTVTFLGDIMISAQPSQWAEREHDFDWTMGEGFDRLLPVRGDYIVGNLEGVITDAPLSYDPNDREGSSFAMKPGAEIIIKEKLHLDVANQGNNHVGDRNVRGFQDTKRLLDSVGIAHFGAGMTTEEAATPHIFTTPFGQTVGISSFSTDTCCKYFRMEDGTKVRTALDPGDEDHVQLAMELQERAGADFKIAFVHWGPNYQPVTKDVRKKYAPLLTDTGYDMIIGSAGSHTVQPFDYINDVPVFFDVGNFLLEKATRFHNLNPDPKGKHDRSLPYGSVAHVVFDDVGPVRLEIQCTFVDNEIVRYRPRYCHDDESYELFSSLGEYAKFTKGSKYATIDLRNNTRTLP